MDIETIKKNKNWKWLLVVVIIFFIAFLLLLSLYLFFENKYKNKIYPGVSVGRIDLSGATKSEVKKILNNKINLFNQNGVTFHYGDEKTVLFPVISSFESDLAYQIINFDIDKTVDKAYSIGRNDKFFKNLINKINALIERKSIELVIEINSEEIEKILKEKLSLLESPAQNARLSYIKQALPGQNEDYQFIVEEEINGKTINYKNGIIILRSNLVLLNFDSIELTSEEGFPQIYKKDCLNIENKAKAVLDLVPIVLKYNKLESVVEKNTAVDWLILKINPDSENKQINNSEEKIIVSLNTEEVEKYLQSELAPKINKTPREAKFEIKDGRVAIFQASSDGVELDVKKNSAKIETELINNKNNIIELDAIILSSANSMEKVNDLGIREIIGTGQSNFSGSPANRRHNIKTGANALNGILIKPDEEFSLLKALGDIDGSTGYLQELVIKDNKTIPEFGGGLCQIGTTVFRTTLASGLPVTMRRNHSYRVSYYEPAGTDATIYSPWPDYKFINDTGSYILIQSRFDGDTIFFDFWGKKDGRTVEKTDPTIYNIVKPGATKLIETLDLKPGEKKCTERAHNGADAFFNYKVTYANGEVKENKFSSHYVPWREVCLIGVEKLSEAVEKDVIDNNKEIIKNEIDNNPEVTAEN